MVAIDEKVISGTISTDYGHTQVYKYRRKKKHLDSYATQRISSTDLRKKLIIDVNLSEYHRMNTNKLLNEEKKKNDTKSRRKY